jgi:hypothetical protein
MMPSVHELFTPLKEAEKSRLPAVVAKLFHNEDFQLLFRWMNQNCGGIASTSFEVKVEDTYKAAWKDGQKAIPRDLFARYIESVGPEKDKPTTQDTSHAIEIR